jgi:hypothetical protein
MASSGHELGADLIQIKMIGTVDLPALGHTYTTIGSAIASTASDSGAFARQGGPNLIAGPWTALRDQLLGIFAGTADNLQATSAVMIHIVEAYAATDSAAANTVAGAWRDGQPSPDQLLPSEKAYVEATSPARPTP